MRIEQLRYFVEIAKINSMSIAAEKLRIAQPSLSFSIRQLEDELEIKLFSRSKKGTFLTKEGEEIYPRVAKILELIDSLYPSAKPEIELIGKLNLLSVAVFNPVITEIMMAFLNKKTKIEQKITISNAELINKKISECHNNYDFIITSVYSPHIHKHSKELLKYYRAWIIADTYVFILASEKSPYASQKSISLTTLKKLPIINYSTNDLSVDDFFCSILKNHYGITLRTAINVNIFSDFVKYIESGIVYGLTTPFIQEGIHNTLNKRTLFLIPLKEKIPISFVLLSSKNKQFTPVQQMFFNEFCKYYPQMNELQY